MIVETTDHADLRDATYLACQLRTNHAVVHHKARMQQALSNLHQVYLDVSEGAESQPVQVRQRDTAPLRLDIPVPRIDTVSSRPRSSTPSLAEAALLHEELVAAGVRRKG